jgi:hypothetical protein
MQFYANQPPPPQAQPPVIAYAVPVQPVKQFSMQPKAAPQTQGNRNVKRAQSGEGAKKRRIGDEQLEIPALVSRLQTPEEIEQWRAERRKNYPSKANVERKDNEHAAKQARGELVERKPRFAKPSARKAARPSGAARPTLLRKLLETQIKKEYSAVFQCLRYLCSHNFLQDDPPEGELTGYVLDEQAESELAQSADVQQELQKALDEADFDSSESAGDAQEAAAN